MTFLDHVRRNLPSTDIAPGDVTQGDLPSIVRFPSARPSLDPMLVQTRDSGLLAIFPRPDAPSALYVFADTAIRSAIRHCVAEARRHEPDVSLVPPPLTLRAAARTFLGLAPFLPGRPADVHDRVTALAEANRLTAEALEPLGLAIVGTDLVYRHQARVPGAGTVPTDAVIVSLGTVLTALTEVSFTGLNALLDHPEAELRSVLSNPEYQPGGRFRATGVCVQRQLLILSLSDTPDSAGTDDQEPEEPSTIAIPAGPVPVTARIQSPAIDGLRDRYHRLAGPADLPPGSALRYRGGYQGETDHYFVPHTVHARRGFRLGSLDHTWDEAARFEIHRDGVWIECVTAETWAVLVDAEIWPVAKAEVNA